MMANLRMASKNVMLKVILMVIIFSFVVTGISGYLISNYKSYVVKVNKEKINQIELERGISIELEKQKEILGNKFYEVQNNKDYLKAIHDIVLNKIVDRTLLTSYRKSLNVDVSDAYVKNFIMNSKIFQNNGKFDNSKYIKMIHNAGFSSKEYADSIRLQLANAQLFNAIIDTDFMLNNEVNRITDLILQTRSIREAIIDVNKLSEKESVTNEEIKQYYTDNPGSFLLPDRFNISYIKLDLSKIKMTVSHKEIKKWYTLHKKEYFQPALYKYRIIQTKSKKEAENILLQLKKGANFAKLAKHKSIDIPSAHNGGNIGWLNDLNITDELKSANLTHKKQLSDVIKIPNGFLIARLDAIKEKTVLPLSKVSDIIVQRIKNEKAIVIMKKLQEKLSNKDIDNKSLTNAKKILNTQKILKVKVKNLGWVDSDQLLKKLNFSELKQFLSNKTFIDEKGILNKKYDIVNIKDNLSILLLVNDYKPQATEPFDNEVAIKITHILKKNKALIKAKEKANALLNKIKEDPSKATNILSEVGLKLGKTIVVNRNSEKDPVSEKSFKLELPTKNGSSWGICEDNSGNLVLISLDKVKNNDYKIGKESKTKLVNNILTSNTKVLLETILEYLKNTSTIKYGYYSK